MDELRDALAARADRLVGWELTERSETSSQRLYRGEGRDLAVHQQREVHGHRFRLRTRVVVGDAVGVGTLDIDPLRPVAAQVDLCMQLAEGALNPRWTEPVPPPSGYPEVVTCDLAVHADPEAALERVEARLRRAVGLHEGVRCNSAEIYVTAADGETWTGTGIHTVRRTTALDVDLAMEPQPGPNLEEVHERLAGVSESDLDVEAFVETAAEEARQLGRSALPPSGSDIPVLIHARDASLLLHALAGTLTARAEFMKRTQLSVGDTVHVLPLARGSDRLLLALDPFRPAMVNSRAATREGRVPAAGALIRDNEVVAQAVSGRYGEYLGRAPNDLVGNVVVSPGTASVEALLATRPRVLEVVRFSSLNVHPVALTWSSEIKLARLHDGSGTPTWVKGGVVAGNIRENLSDFSLSSEEAVVNVPGVSMEPPIGYVGPAAMLLRAGVSVTGA